MNHVVFEYATGIICRGPEEHAHLKNGDLVTVRTHDPDLDRTARVRVALADSIVSLGKLKGMPGSHDWLLEWQRDEPVVMDRPMVIFGSRSHYTPVRS